MESAEKPSLYDRLGGVYSIATVVDDLIDRVMADPRLNANPLVDEAHHRVPPAGFKYLVTEMVCWAAGGPQKYTGRSMRESHKQLKITGKEWEAFMDDVWLTLDKFKVPGEEQAELRVIVKSTRRDIVSDPAPSQVNPTSAYEGRKANLPTLPGLRLTSREAASRIERGR
jgi:hemoglobin